LDYSQQDDRALLELIKAGHPGALDELYARYGRLVYSIALYVTNDTVAAEDVTLQVFTKVWEKGDLYRPERGSARVWLTTLTRNHAIDILRQEKAHTRIESQLMAETSILPETYRRKTESEVDLRLRQELVRSAIGQLTEQQRQVLIMAYFLGYTHTEIANELGLPLGTVKTRIRSAIQELRQLLESQRTT
jgi:RNA polymerase sigma-70 factor (ECF subfamily)